MLCIRDKADDDFTYTCFLQDTPEFMQKHFQTPTQSSFRLMTSDRKYRYTVPVQVDYLYIRISSS